MADTDGLASDQTVYRSITRGRDYQDGMVMASAFLKRPAPKDPDGLSLNYNVRVPDGCFGDGKKAVVSSQVGKVEALPFDLKVRADFETHAVITNLPYAAIDERAIAEENRSDVWLNPELAEQIAVQLRTAFSTVEWAASN